MFGFLSIPILCLVLFFHQGIMVEDVRNVTGYMDKSVVLQSNADPSWTLKTIQWSIYDNFTYIAFLVSKTENVNLNPLFQGRLELNKVSGDLKITNVLSRDTLKYRVDLAGNQTNQRKTSYVQLFVWEQLSKPIIRLRHKFLDLGYCVISLSCSSMDSKVLLSWQPEHGFSESIYSDPLRDSKTQSELVLWTSFTPNRTVNFSCIAADDSHKESSHMTVMCTEPIENKEARLNYTQPCPQIQIKGKLNGVVIGTVIGVILFVCLGAFIIIKNKGEEVHLVDSPLSAAEMTPQGEEVHLVDSPLSAAEMTPQGAN